MAGFFFEKELGEWRENLNKTVPVLFPHKVDFKKEGEEEDKMRRLGYEYHASKFINHYVKRPF